MLLHFPAEIQGWLTLKEGQALHNLADGKRVLELGAWKGRSTVCMAQSAKYLEVVDHFQGDPGTGPGVDVRKEFDKNIERYYAQSLKFEENWSHVTVQQCFFKDAKIEREYYDLVFVDGAHDVESAKESMLVAARAVKPGGIIALHDWHYPTVKQAAKEALGWEDSRGGVNIDALYYRKYIPGEKPKPPVPKVLIGIPHRDWCAPGVFTGIIESSKSDEVEIVAIKFHSTSLLSLCFNTLWCQALNEREKLGITHFAMHHADIEPQGQWLPTLLREMQETGADVLSCVVPIKDPRGLSSTAVMEKNTRQMRRLTIHETMKMPRSFTAEDIGYKNHYLLVNSGLWVCDFTKPWVEKICFTIRDKVLRDPKTGEFSAMCFSEDWIFSVDAQRLGLKVMATNAVKLSHVGSLAFPNFAEWGGWKEDQAKGQFIPPAQKDFFPMPHVEPKAL